MEKAGFNCAVDEAGELLEHLKNTKDPSLIGKLLFAITRIADSLDAEAEETLYIENNTFVSHFKSN